MKTVPTLCVTGCSLSLAAVGCTIGIECSETSQRTPPSTHTRPHPHQQTDNQIRSSNLLTFENATSRSCSSDPASLPRYQEVFKEQPGNTVKSERSHTGTSDVSPENHSSIQRRTSRLQRLSSLTLSRSSSNHRPVSRTFTQSSDSTAPLFKTDPTGIPPAPNKLVKRSLSQHMSTNPSPLNLTAKKQTFRRPATSHQRAATNPITTEGTHTPGTRIKPTTSQITKSSESRQHKSYFFLQLSGAYPDTQLTEDTIDDRKYRTRRLNVKFGSTPHLVVAHSIETPIDIELDKCSESEDCTSRTWTYRPVTANGLIKFSSSSPPTFVGTPYSESGSSSHRSFSIGNVLPSGNLRPWRKSGKVSALGRRLSLRSNKRALLAPSVSMEGDTKKTVENGSKPAKRRNTRVSSPVTPEKVSVFEAPGQLPFSDEAPLDTNNRHLTSAELVTPVALSSPNRSPSQGSPSLSHSASSVGLTHAGSRPSRLSETPSDVNSSQVGSDHDVRVFSSGDDDDDDDDDNRSDTVYDSLRTGATRGSGGQYPTKLEALFDKHSEADESVPEHPYRNELGHLTAHESEVHVSSSIAEEDENLSTPVRTTVGEERGVAQGQGLNRTPKARFSVSPHLGFHELKLGELEWDVLDNQHDWSDDEDDGSVGAFDGLDHDQDSPISQRSRNNILRTRNRGNQTLNPTDLDVKNSLFDWSEQPPLDRNNANISSQRPKTVHGKKGSDNRGNRAGGVRGAGRASSGLHARSQSVPVTPDADGRRAQIKNKFGTWGIASKGVPEDWNDDFDFDEESNDSKGQSNQPSSSVAPENRAVVVPNSIREQQTNVIANIGLLREWGLHIEELKELRMRAASLGLLEGDYASLFDEVDAMIDLADQEAEDANPLSIETTPDFKRELRDSPRTEPVGREQIASDVSNENPADQPASADITWTPPAPTSRPRKDSEAIAQSVIEAIQQRRTLSEELAHEQRRSRTKRVPFDTATLRHIVPYVNRMMRKVKQAIREKEGLQESTRSRPSTPDPPFRQAFINHVDI